MNQIIQEDLNGNYKDKKLNIIFDNRIHLYDSGNKMKKNKNFYKIQFFISFFIAVISVIFLSNKIYINNKKEKISKQLLNTYQLTTVYSDNDNSNITKSSFEDDTPFVIGMIKIDKIDLNYPILSNSTDDLLKIGLCRFIGPMPNQKGNLCIVGHNYLDNRFFSRLNELNINDIIEIYDLNGNKKQYHIFQKYEIKSDDLSCTNQNVGNKSMVTLLTCDNIDNSKRLVIKAK